MINQRKINLRKMKKVFKVIIKILKVLYKILTFAFAFRNSKEYKDIDNEINNNKFN